MSIKPYTTCNYKTENLSATSKRENCKDTHKTVLRKIEQCIQRDDKLLLGKKIRRANEAVTKITLLRVPSTINFSISEFDFIHQRWLK